MTTLVLPPLISDRLLGLCRLGVESGAVLLARVFRTPRQQLRLLATELVLVPEEAYEHRGPRDCRIASAGFVPPLCRAEAARSIPVWVHTHPGEGVSLVPSRRDRLVDQQLGPLFRMRSGAEFYGSLVVSSRGSALSFTGRLESEIASIALDRIWCVGPRFALTHNAEVARPEPAFMYDRNVRAFGGAVQQVLRDLVVAVVGCGGTGSAVVEQLVRLGVRQFLLIDPDRLSESNVTRVYGSGLADVGRPKVEVLSDHLRRIMPDVVIEAMASKVTVEQTARALIDADIVFGCTDDNAGRLVLSRLSVYFLIPVIDCGVILTSDPDGCLDGINGRVTVLHPGSACLVCRDRIDLQRAAAESLSPVEYLGRVREGYAPALPGVEPAVVSFTTLVAAQAVSELLERLTSFGPPEVPNEVLLRIHEREVSTNVAEPRDRHYCHPATMKLGIGMTEPFLEQTWGA